MTTLDIAQDFQQYFAMMEDAKSKLVPKWFDMVSLIDDNNRWKLALIIENSVEKGPRDIGIDGKMNNAYAAKSTAYAVADWFLNFPYKNAIAIQPMIQPCGLVFFTDDDGRNTEAVTARTQQYDSVKSSLAELTVLKIIEAAGEIAASVPEYELEAYTRYLHIPENTKLTAIIRNSKKFNHFDTAINDGVVNRVDGIDSIYTSHISSDEVIFCFTSNSDFLAGAILCPYMIGLRITDQKLISRGGIFIPKNSRKFYHKVKII